MYMLYFVAMSSNPPPATQAPAGDDDFDMFAQSRQSFDTNKQALG